MKASPARELAIRFVVDRHGRHHDVAGMSLRDIHRHPDGRNSFRCAGCLEPVGTRAGFVRRPYFAHSPAEPTTPYCAWRSDNEHGLFFGRNPTGDDGKWHIDAQCEIMTVLESMGCDPARNVSVRTDGGLRKPDVAVTMDGQLVHFEVQASPTDGWCANRRMDRDFRHRAVTIWIVSADAFRRAIAEKNPASLGRNAGGDGRRSAVALGRRLLPAIPPNPVLQSATINGTRSDDDRDIGISNSAASDCTFLCTA